MVPGLLQGMLLSVLSGICYGSLSVLAKLGYAAGMTPAEVLLCRFVFGSVFLGLFLLVRARALFRISLRRLAAVSAVGMFVFCAQSMLFFTALTSIPASTATLILYVYPLSVTLLSIPVFKLRVDRRMALSLALVLGGCCLVFYDAFAREIDPGGLTLAVAALGVFTVYLVLCQIVTRGAHPLTVSFYMILACAGGFLIAKSPAPLLHLRGDTLLYALGLGLFPTALSLSLLFLAIEKIGSAQASLFSSVEPLATMLLAHLVLGEHVDVWQLGGATLILAGIAWPVAGRMRNAGSLPQPS